MSSGTKHARIPSQISAEMAYILLSMIGCMVRVCLEDGSEWEGLFDSLCDGQVSVSLAKQLGMDGRLEGMAKWPLSKIKWIRAEGVDLEECREGRVPSSPKSAFQTDGEISKESRAKERDLKPWQADNQGDLIELPTGNDRIGWDQFAVNESLFGIKCSFDESQYTTPLPDANDPGYAERAKEAERIAQEILSGQKADSWHLREERGEELDTQLTEEDLYGAVLTSAPPVKASWASLAANKQATKPVKSDGKIEAQSGPHANAPKSLVNRQTDPQALEEAIQSVEQSQKSLQRRLSQLSNGDKKLNPEAPEWKPRVDAPAFVPAAYFPPPPPPPPQPYYEPPSYGVYINGLFVPNYMLNRPPGPPPQ